MSALLPTYTPFPFTMEKAEGVYVYSTTGEKYLDLYGGHCVSLLGHSPSIITDAITEQAKKFYFYSMAGALPIREEAATSLAHYTHPDLAQFFFCNSGAEANEIALKLSIQKKKRKKLIGFKNGWHGRSLLCMSVTDDATWHNSMLGWCGDNECIEVNNEASLKNITSDVAAVILEPIQSIGGVLVATTQFLKALRERCTEVGAWLIFDEIQTGIGRTGLPFVSGFSGVTPDMMTLAKGLASGFPIGALAVTQEVSSTLVPGDLGSTFGGGPVAMAALKASLTHIREIEIHKHVQKVSEYAFKKLMEPSVVEEVRGKGLLLGLKLKQPAKKIQEQLISKKILTGTSGDPYVLRLLPPLIINESHVDTLSNSLCEV